MTATRYLIVNADDFGQSQSVNWGVMEAHEHGIVTSASLMVRWPAAAEAARYSREHPHLSVGLHVDFGEWACKGEQWVTRYAVVSSKELSATAEEVSRQLAAFRRLMGKDPTHIDSHQHAHLGGPLRTVVTQVAREFSLPLRHYNPDVHYNGHFYGQTAQGESVPSAITGEALTAIFESLPSGCTELVCHPGAGNDRDTMYCSERSQEVKVLCDPQTRTSIAKLGIELRSFRDCPFLGSMPQMTQASGRGKES